MAGALTLRMRGWRPWRTSWLIVGTNYDSLVFGDYSTRRPLPRAVARVNRSSYYNWWTRCSAPGRLLPLVPLPHRERHAAAQAAKGDISKSRPFLTTPSLPKHLLAVRLRGG